MPDGGLSPTSQEEQTTENTNFEHITRKGHHYGKSLITTERGQGWVYNEAIYGNHGEAHNPFMNNGLILTASADNVNTVDIILEQYKHDSSHNSIRRFPP